MEWKKKKIIWKVLGVTSILLIALGTSYAYWIFTKDQIETNLVSTDCFKIEFLEEQEGIHLGNAYPVFDEEGLKNSPYTFQIRNICNSDATYQINLETMALKNDEKSLPDEYVKVGLQEGNSPSIITRLEEENEVLPSIEGATTAYQIQTGTLRKNETKTFHLRLWMDEATPANEKSMNAIYQGKISIIATYLRDPFLKSGTLMARNDQEAFWQSKYREKITRIIFEPEMIPHETAEELIFDVSANQDQSVMSYLIPDEEGENYTLYLQSTDRKSVV